MIGTNAEVFATSVSEVVSTITQKSAPKKSGVSFRHDPADVYAT